MTAIDRCPPRSRTFLIAVLVLGPACHNQKPAPAPIDVSFKAGCNPFATTSECLYPFPSSFFQVQASTPTGFQNAWPSGIFGGSSSIPSVEVDPTQYNTADGVSPVTPLLMFFAGDVNLSNLPNQTQIADSMAPNAPIALVDVETGERVPYFAEMDQNRPAGVVNRYAFIVRPVAPMTEGHRHALILTDSVALADGSPLPVSPAFAALRDGQITTSQEIEAVRPTYEKIFTIAQTLGYGRAHIALAYDFMVASQTYLLGPILAMRAQALQEAGLTGEGYSNGTLTYTVDSVSTTSLGGELVEGNFGITNYVNTQDQFDWGPNHLPVEQPAGSGSEPYTVYIPSEDLKVGGTPLPLGIFGHGLLGSGREYLATGSDAPIIQGMAERVGAILIATDWTGLTDSTNDSANALLVASDINELGTITERLTQSLVNNLEMTKLGRGPLLTNPAINPPSDHVLLDPTRTYYYGVSLGGIQGASLVSLSDDISRGILSVPGAAWSTMLPRSIDWVAFETAAVGVYPDPLQEVTLLSLAQGRFDFTDGANITRLMFQDPLPGTPQKTVLLQESIDDCQVQNVVTEILARSIGVQQLTPDYESIFNLPTLGPVTTNSVISQYYLVADVDKYVPPDTDVAPAQDNGAHFDLNVQPQSQQQIVDFLQTGYITQYCPDGGVCIIDQPDAG